ncbi:hypothetical protein [Spiroplasma turonicum]|uniref:Uncharacterized protein n=1 Tax=Spiroplasma turonicum TaxID=216946 RepID=A0A0K1P5H1_9MOLU|nr:hypothetical protein [Spiroplasma turonicum]AKU79551.1 hypothetical protein STURON_00305 [Spiroplasma turonicum]ALX70574.1 hypothetical protein STURO_v1c03060 [Spiroplasma turonicum]
MVKKVKGTKKKYQNNIFNLISDKTKLRIKGLIEKRLTTKTVLLFAQEYESYDIEVRRELIAYIAFLFNEEEEKFNKDYSQQIQQDPRAQHLQQIRWLELSEKRENIKKIEDILIKRDQEVVQENLKINKPKNSEKDKEIELKSKQSKPVKVKIEESKLDKMLKEAQLREENEAKLRQRKIEEEKLKKQAIEKERALRSKKALEKKQETKNIDKLLKVEPKVTEKVKNDSKLSDEKNNKQDVQAEKVVKSVQIDRNYEKEQAEKEKLWKELYGSSRSDKSRLNLPNENTSVKKVFKPSLTDKTPTFDYDELTHFVICGRKFDFEEYSNVNNKYFIFWRKMTKKFRMSNITVWLNLNIDKQPKLLKKRLKFQKKLEKRFKTNNNINNPKPSNNATDDIKKNSSENLNKTSIKNDSIDSNQ